MNLDDIINGCQSEEKTGGARELDPGETAKQYSSFDPSMETIDEVCSSILSDNPPELKGPGVDCAELRDREGSTRREVIENVADSEPLVFEWTEESDPLLKVKNLEPSSFTFQMDDNEFIRIEASGDVFINPKLKFRNLGDFELYALQAAEGIFREAVARKKREQLADRGT